MARDEQRPGIRPRPTLGRQLDIAARASFPASTTILLMLAAVAPFNIAGQSALLPAVALAAVWFWSVFRPASMPPVAVFGIGVLLDLFGYLPLGTGVLTLLCVHGIAMRGRRLLARHGFALVWFGFGLVAVGAAAQLWLLTCLLSFRLVPLGPALYQAMFATALYPALAIPLAAAHRGIADPDQA